MIRLIRPSEVRRPVRRIDHFEPRSKSHILEVTQNDPWMRKLLLKRRRTRPYGHDVILLTCGHVVTKIRQRPGRVLYPALPCALCTKREDEMNVRYIRADLKKKRRKKRQSGRLVLRRQHPVIHLKRRKK